MLKRRPVKLGIEVTCKTNKGLGLIDDFYQIY